MRIKGIGKVGENNLVDVMKDSGKITDIKFKIDDFNSQYTTGKELGRFVQFVLDKYINKYYGKATGMFDGYGHATTKEITHTGYQKMRDPENLVPRRGQFAIVKTCTHNDTDGTFAAKFIKKKRTSASKLGMSREAISREASILSTINHDKIIKLYEAYETKSEIILILELVNGGELFEEICDQEYLTEIEASYYTRQVLEAVEHLHNLSIVHLDIKPENIILKEKGHKQIKLVDFGLAQKLLPGKELREMMGTAEFVAPEIINYDALGSYTDMWAVGVLAYILLSGSSPFLGDNNDETYRNILKLNYDFDDEFFADISKEAKDFVTKLLLPQPKQRSTASDCLHHEWIKGASGKPLQRSGSVVIPTAAFKAFVARRRWQRSFKKIAAINRLRLLVKPKARIIEETPKEVEKEKEQAKPIETVANPGTPITARLFKDTLRASSYPNLTSHNLCLAELHSAEKDENGNNLSFSSQTIVFQKKRPLRLSLSLNMADKQITNSKEFENKINYVPDPQPKAETKANIEVNSMDLKKSKAAE